MRKRIAVGTILTGKGPFPMSPFSGRANDSRLRGAEAWAEELAARRRAELSSALVAR